MTQVGTPRFETIRAAVRMTEEACRLPAVATLDWLDRASAVLRGVVTPSRASIMIVNTSPGSRALSLEAAGYAATPGIDHDDSGTELSVRSKAERLGDLGFTIENEVVGLKEFIRSLAVSMFSIDCALPLARTTASSKLAGWPKPCSSC